MVPTMNTDDWYIDGTGSIRIQQINGNQTITSERSHVLRIDDFHINDIDMSTNGEKRIVTDVEENREDNSMYWVLCDDSWSSRSTRQIS